MRFAARLLVPVVCLLFGAAQLDSSAPADPWVEKTLASLTLEKKIAQLVCPDITTGYIAEGDPRLAHWDSLAHVWGVGMFVLYGGTPRDVAHLLNRLQRESAVPLLISADFEGGPGQQVTGATEYPPNMAFAAAGSEELMYRATSAAAVEGRAMGIHLTYTPVVDIAVRPENPAEAGRSFGGNFELMAKLIPAYVRGYHDNGMLATAKHFPGRGDAEPMPDNAPWTWNPKPVDQLRAQEFRNFKIGIDAGVDFVMTEHIAVPAATGGSTLPASMEPKLATGWLRDSLGFKGMLTTDDLWYAWVVNRFGAEEAALRAFEAGHDIMLKPKDPVAVIKAMAAAVRSGRISEKRIDDAVRRLLTLKAKLKLNADRLVDESKVNALVGTPVHLAIAQETADRSMTLLRNDGVLPVAPALLAHAVNINVQKSDGDPSPAQLSAKLAAAFPGLASYTLKPDMDPAQYEKIMPAIVAADLVIISMFVQRDRAGSATPVRPADLAFLQRLIAAKPHAVVMMSYGNPHLVRALPTAPAFITGYAERGWYGNQPVYFDSFIKLLKGDLRPTGKLPIDAGPGFPIGTGLTY